MSSIILESIIASLCIVGIYQASQYELDRNGLPTNKNILWFFSYYTKKVLPMFIFKPVIGCPRCMATVWGSALYFGVLHYSINSLDSCFRFIIFVLMVSALNGIFNKFAE